MMLKIMRPDANSQDTIAFRSGRRLSAFATHGIAGLGAIQFEFFQLIIVRKIRCCGFTHLP